MLTRDVISSEDLAEIRRTALGDADPLGVAADLAEAVDEGRLANPEDAGYALSLATEIAEVRSRLGAALQYADRAVAAYPEEDAPGAGFARALRARVLFRLGRDDEALAAITPLRPLLTEEPDAAVYISAALDAGRQTATAEEWLSAAVDTMLEARGESAEEVGPAEAPGVLFFLLQQRHRVRRDLNLPHDRQDDLADRLEARLTRETPHDHAESDLVFFPKPEFDRLPAGLAEVYGADWDEHRARLEKALVHRAEEGAAGLGVLRATVDGLTSNGDPTDAGVRGRYANQLADLPNTHVAWPPERNAACWCGSGLKYKKDCLPRSRA
ncbi:SEC-C domain-containing protein [Asanoa siamensis]|uniref:Preprotein translocase SecA n=1 Tax=Asanoa siamensis TaxID=926357 RepID=A0ABQ4D289_9ACTN|nr:SEC-C domain-containing protein [Asanoa siamensis]GIF77656.1 preprotein translocase SecA [Asanoa siamensis]